MPIFLESFTNKKIKQMKGEEIKVFFMVLEEMGVKEIQIAYDGAGDNGSIDDISCYDENDDLISCDQYHDKIESVGYHILNHYYDVDWYNNDGGHGVIHIYVRLKSWEIDGYYREMQSIDAPAHGNLESVIDSFKE